MTTANTVRLGSAGSAAVLVLFGATPDAAGFALGSEELVSAGGSTIAVPGYSVPSFVPWDGDVRPDLIVGEGGGGSPDGKVRVYLNTGSAEAPQFGDFSYAQSLGSDLIVAGGG